MAITKSEDIDAWPQNISDFGEQKDEESWDHGNTPQRNLSLICVSRFKPKQYKANKKLW